MSREQIVQIVRILITAALALAAVFGYDLGVLQPRQAANQQETLQLVAEMVDSSGAQVLAAAGSGANTAGISHFNNVEAYTIKAAAPTSVGTATPAAVIDSLGVSNLFEVRDAATPVAYIADGGHSTFTTVVDVGTFVNLSEAAATTVTDGAVFTPTATYCPITAGSEVTPTVSTSGYVSGDLLILINEGTNTINLADSGTMMLTAAWAADQYDLLALWFDGTNWIELSRADN